MGPPNPGTKTLGEYVAPLGLLPPTTPIPPGVSIQHGTSINLNQHDVQLMMTETKTNNLYRCSLFMQTMSTSFVIICTTELMEILDGDLEYVVTSFNINILLNMQTS